MKISITGVEAIARGFDGDIKKLVSRLADEVYTDARQNTPVKTGNARKNWNKKITKTGAVVDNKVPYIERLEAGASKQAPKGIIGPTLSQIKGKV
jgi:HK97 gp10 family phage protein